jgi:signal transduction histidine kinase
MELSPMLLPALAAALLIGAIVAAGITDGRRQRRALLGARAERDQARADESAAVRTLHLAAIELRGPATTLLGHADRLGANGGGAPAGATTGVAIGAIARQLLDLADDLQHHALADAASRVLREERTSLATLLIDAVAAVQASLEPGRRHWRLPPEIDGIELIADRRAMAQILARVLGSAARFSHHDDWIDVTLAIGADRFALIVADEGNGLAATHGAGERGRADSRGLGLGLALARVLMEAHGGALLVEAVPSVGARVTLELPISRLIRAAPTEPARAPPAAIPVAAEV